jgi:tetratricopeptide (TPR) repeat protein
VVGDTAAVSSFYRDMLAAPANYSDTQLFEAGLAAARAGRDADAQKLLQAGLDKNPYSRDGLFNLAVVLFNQKKWTELAPVAKKLTQIDPNNPEGWRMLAAAHNGIGQGAKVAAVKKAEADSTMQAYQKYDQMPIVVTFSLFRHDGAKHTLRGTVENRGTAAKTPTLHIEFLDSKGNVVATKEAAVGSVKPKGKQDFEVTVEQEGITAFRYAPVA